MSVILAYKNFAANRNISHIGLGVAAINTSKVLRNAGIKTDVWPILSAGDLRQKLTINPAEHVIISAPWIPTVELQSLSTEFSGYALRDKLPLQCRIPASGSRWRETDA